LKTVRRQCIYIWGEGAEVVLVLETLMRVWRICHLHFFRFRSRLTVTGLAKVYCESTSKFVMLQDSLGFYRKEMRNWRWTDGHVLILVVVVEGWN
jgi:hypothetical protein